MGASNSRMSTSTSRSAGGRGDRSNFRLSSLLCGTSFSDDLPPRQIEDCPNDIAEHAVNERQQSTVKNASMSSQNAYLGQSSSVVEKDVIHYGSSSAETSDSFKCFSDSRVIKPSNSVDQITERKELFPCGRDVDSCVGTHSGRISDQSLSLIKSLPFGSSSITRETTSAPIVEGNTSTVEPSLETHSERMGNLPQQENIHFSPVEIPSTENQPLGNEPVRDVASLTTGSHRAMVHGEQRSVLHVDVVSISSDILTSSGDDVTNREARRNSRRLFWDAFSRRSSRRNYDMPSVTLSTEDSDDLGSHSRWLLDFSDDTDTFENGIGDASRFFSGRRHGGHERRRRSRSELWERLRGDLDESTGNTTLCASGLHPEGTCSCESLLMAEISSARASISRIVLLAEALFEVLDEIHRQPDSLSFSMVSHPAPESVVNSFPVKNYMKTSMPQSGDDIEQCYICLAEYEERDAIRALPCRHEYHMACVDKWLKEIHGVCPLCRRDVCEGVAEIPASSS